MSSWVISSNPATYNAEGSLTESGEIDWVTKNNFSVGDIVYIYEVIPPRGRGGIVYKTEVMRTNLSLDDKLDDRKFWKGQAYPRNITEKTRFSRLRLISEPIGGGLALKELKKRGFTAPQGMAYRVVEPLKSYVESFFQLASDSENEEIANEVISNDNLKEVTQALKELANHLPPKRIELVARKVARNPKIANLIKESKQYICEICERKPFIQKNGQPYAEADHIQPLGGFTKGLDTPENIRCLCAQCHAVITYGSKEVILNLLSSSAAQYDLD
jgi:predicted HNH restriction endonuclease